MRVFKAIIGSLLVVLGLGLVVLGVDIAWQFKTLEAAEGFVVLFGLGMAVIYVGYQLARGDSLKDALYFLSFFH
ncbi:hypothetical protein [Streptomyces sp. NPDC059631]|uniref:hypothetical protein n=1 Tax=unclassified Streptomyces TaxID=2593676 RepID=UPI0036CC6817